MSKDLILISIHSGGYYNGQDDDGWPVEVERTTEISDSYIFETEEDIKSMDEYNSRVQNWYNIVKLSEQLLKHTCPYDRNKFKPVLKRGSKNETCSYCGTNILAKEPYLIWRAKQKFCLHCVVNQLGNVESLFGSTPAELKEEWKANGKEKAIECLEYILKGVDG